jgi:hypothetical protein
MKGLKLMKMQKIGKLMLTKKGKLVVVADVETVVGLTDAIKDAFVDMAEKATSEAVEAITRIVAASQNTVVIATAPAPAPAPCVDPYESYMKAVGIAPTPVAQAPVAPVDSYDAYLAAVGAEVSDAPDAEDSTDFDVIESDEEDDEYDEEYNEEGSDYSDDDDDDEDEDDDDDDEDESEDEEYDSDKCSDKSCTICYPKEPIAVPAWPMPTAFVDSYDVYLSVVGKA